MDDSDNATILIAARWVPKVECEYVARMIDSEQKVKTYPVLHLAA
jgi:hypothetical protein